MDEKIEENNLCGNIPCCNKATHRVRFLKSINKEEILVCKKCSKEFFKKEYVKSVEKL